MKIFKKIISLSLVLIMALAMLAGCNNNTVDQDENKNDGSTTGQRYVLTIWGAAADQDRLSSFRR